MNLKETLRTAQERYNKYGQDLEEVSKHAKDRWDSYDRNHQPKSYDRLEK